MKPANIKAGMTCSIGWFHTSAMTCVRTDYRAHGNIIARRGGKIKFQWISGDTMDCDFIATPRESTEFFWANLLDIKSINGIPVHEWSAMTAETYKAKARAEFDKYIPA